MSPDRYEWRFYCDDPQECLVCGGEQSECTLVCRPQFATRLRQLGQQAGHADARLEQLDTVQGGLHS